MKRSLKKGVTWYMLLVMFLIGITPRVYADFSPSEVIGLSHFDRTADLQKIQKVLESRMIRERLSQIGFTEEEIQGRISQFSDEQIHQLALKIDELKVAGDGGGVVLVVLLIAILVVLFFYLMGHRIVVK
jgi:hypothetical protein